MVFAQPIESASSRILFCNFCSANNAKSILPSFSVQKLNSFSSGEVVLGNLDSVAFDKIASRYFFRMLLQLLKDRVNLTWFYIFDVHGCLSI